MTELVGAEKMRRIEQHIMEETQIAPIVLMERAAQFCAQKILERAGSGKKILIACGTGNNGADGLAAARILLEKGCRVTVVTVGEEQKRTDCSMRQMTTLQSIAEASGDSLQLLPFANWRDGTERREDAYHVIVDALLGIGASRPLAGELKECVELLNRLSGDKVAVDLPTGIHTDTGVASGSFFQADLTVTFGRIKTGLVLQDGKKAAGEICVDTCGMYYPGIEKQVYDKTEKAVFSMEREDLKRLLARDVNGNKGSFGKLAMIVGSREMPGAAVLSASAAFRSGAGYLQVCTHADNRAFLVESCPETVLKLYDDADMMIGYLKELAAFADVMALGCGCTKAAMKGCLPALAALLEKESKMLKALVLDADALNVLAEADDLLRRFTALPCRVILTPHLKEFERLSRIPVAEIRKDRLNIAKKFAAANHCILVLKDAQTVIASPDGDLCINRFGNAGMAVAGSGDVLCGVIAAMAGQIEEPYTAACAGVLLHALAGDAASETHGQQGMLPQDMIGALTRCGRD